MVGVGFSHDPVRSVLKRVCADSLEAFHHPRSRSEKFMAQAESLIVFAATAAHPSPVLVPLLVIRASVLGDPLAEVLVDLLEYLRPEHDRPAIGLHRFPVHAV